MDAYIVYLPSLAEAFDCAAKNDIEIVQQQLEYCPEFWTPDALSVLVGNRNFEAAKWLYDSRPKHYFSNILEINPVRGNKRRLGLEDVRWIAF